MHVASLQSGSNGNSIYVEGRGVKLLFDSGISGRQAELRLKSKGRDIRAVDALIISHDHADHVRCAGIYQRKFGLPIHATTKTLRCAASRYPLGKIQNVSHFKAGQRILFGEISVETIPTPHDSVDGVAFVVDDGNRRLGILTDLGHVFSGLDAILGSLDAVFIESNYDSEMLANGPYPASLQQRIRGPGGHLSNLEAAELLMTRSGKRLKWACLAHLSEQNNDPGVALRTHKKFLGKRIELRVASRDRPTGLFQV